MDRMKLLLLMDKMEELVKTSPVVPLTGRVVVPLVAMEDVLQRLREAIPEEALALPDDSQIGSHVSADVHRKLGEAERKSEEIRRGADQYADDVLRRLERSLQEAQTVVRRGRNELKREDVGDETRVYSGPSMHVAAASEAGATERMSGIESVGGGTGDARM